MRAAPGPDKLPSKTDSQDVTIDMRTSGGRPSLHIEGVIKPPAAPFAKSQLDGATNGDALERRSSKNPLYDVRPTRSSLRGSLGGGFVLDESNGDINEKLLHRELAARHIHVHDHHQEYSATHRLPTNSCLEPHDTLMSIVSGGTKKCKYPWFTAIVQAILAGVYIGFGCLTILTGGAQAYAAKEADPGIWKIIMGLMGLPFGLLLVVLTGASLFTSNCMSSPLAWYHRRITLSQCLANWVVSYVGNLAGCLLMVAMTKACDILHGNEEAAIYFANYKTEHSFGAALLRGILANWCVNLAIWQATAAQDVTSKFIGIVLPIASFVVMGFEHSIANMYLIPAGIYHGADVTVGDFILKNLIPVTIGNIISGWLLMGTLYTLLFSRDTLLDPVVAVLQPSTRAADKE